jgi:tetratricopeptide (TPR) repeat protein
LMGRVLRMRQPLQPLWRAGMDAALVHRGRGEALRGVGQYDDAVRAYDAVLAGGLEGMDAAIAHRGRGEVLQHAGNPRDAAEAYGQALAVPGGLEEGERADVLYWRGEALADSGQTVDAQVVRQAAVNTPQLPPPHRAALRGLGITPDEEALVGVIAGHVARTYAAGGAPADDGRRGRWMTTLAGVSADGLPALERMLGRLHEEDVDQRGGEQAVARTAIPVLDLMAGSGAVLTAAVAEVQRGRGTHCVNQPAATFAAVGAVAGFARRCEGAASLSECIGSARDLRGQGAVSEWTRVQWVQTHPGGRRGEDVEVEAGNVMMARVNAARVGRGDPSWPGVPEVGHVAHAAAVDGWVNDRVQSALEASDKARQASPAELSVWLCGGPYAELWARCVERSHGPELDSVRDRFDRYGGLVDDRAEQWPDREYRHSIEAVAINRQRALAAVTERATTEAARAASGAAVAPPMPSSPSPCPQRGL